MAVTPGKGYRFSDPFAVVDINGKGWHDGDQVNRRLGIDPLGGTDPNSSNIKWSPDFFLKGRFQDDQLQVSEYARSDFITVFIWVSNPYGDRHVDVFVDTPGLIENPDMPPINVAAPTVTPPPPPPSQVPATAKPTRVAPTDEPTLEPQPTDAPPPTEVATVPSTATVSEPTDAPLPTRTRPAPSAPTTRPTRVALRVVLPQTRQPKVHPKNQPFRWALSAWSVLLVFPVPFSWVSPRLFSCSAASKSQLL